MGFEFDNLGHFFAVIYDNDLGWKISRFDENFQEVDEFFFLNRPNDFVFNANNDLFLTRTRGNGEIWKVPAGENGIPGSEDAPVLIAAGIYYPYWIEMDESDNLYVSHSSQSVDDGFSRYVYHSILKVNANTGNAVQFADNLWNCKGLAYKDGYLYASEFDRSVVAKFNTHTHEKEDFTLDYGITYHGALGIDSENNLYTHDFRRLKLNRINPDGTFDQVGPGTGYVQSLVNDGTYFYMGSYDIALGNGNQILKINPLTEEYETIGSNLGGWRSVAFDSFGRLVLNTVIDSTQNLYGVDIIDLNSGGTTPYLTGLHNKGRCIKFDANQNFYVVEGIGDGIKKIFVEENYDPPRDISSEPLFYDFRNEQYPDTIYFFDVNRFEEVFIPQMETGQIFIGDKSGHYEVFADGFFSPAQVHFIPETGSLYVCDNGKGLYRISNPCWQKIPALLKIDVLLKEVQASEIQNRVKNSLTSKLENAIKFLEKCNINPAKNIIEAFFNEVKAQSGKKIPVDITENWISQAEVIIVGLSD
ncbi:hypothetical protein ACFLT9_06770 [Acidobacteriota bacterium]